MYEEIRIHFTLFIGRWSVMYTSKYGLFCHLLHYSFKFLDEVVANANKVSPFVTQLASEIDVGLIWTAVSVGEIKTEIAPPQLCRESNTIWVLLLAWQQMSASNILLPGFRRQQSAAVEWCRRRPCWTRPAVCLWPVWGPPLCRCDFLNCQSNFQWRPAHGNKVIQRPSAKLLAIRNI